jgi:hypothetical protein
MDIPLTRLFNQQIADPSFQKPEDIVSWMVAMQAQEFAMAKWAIGLRLPGSTETQVENAFDEGKILRTHLMRPTWHFVSPGDIRWLLQLTAPNIQGLNAYWYKKFELDNIVFKKFHKLVEKHLAGKNFLTRTEINDILKESKIIASGLRLGYLFMEAELQGLICSGPRKGNQFTYALLEERVKKVKSKSPDDALADFMVRYFTSRGPASIKDFCYWSGIKLTQAKKGLALVDSRLEVEKINGTPYYFHGNAMKGKSSTKTICTTFLMPDYDEYGMSYKDRTAISSERGGKTGAYDHLLIVNGKLGGTWAKESKGKETSVSWKTFSPPSKKKREIEAAVEQYRLFLK